MSYGFDASTEGWDIKLPDSFYLTTPIDAESFDRSYPWYNPVEEALKVDAPYLSTSQGQALSVEQAFIVADLARAQKRATSKFTSNADWTSQDSTLWDDIRDGYALSNWPTGEC